VAAVAIPHGLDGAVLADAPELGGALVRSVESGSPAALQGLRANDVIVRANRQSVTNLEELLNRAHSATSLVLEVRRGKATLLIPLR
jgi:S1-C subfamily serine protease